MKELFVELVVFYKKNTGHIDLIKDKFLKASAI